jgi:hypothetical protein
MVATIEIEIMLQVDKFTTVSIAKYVVNELIVSIKWHIVTGYILATEVLQQQL